MTGLDALLTLFQLNGVVTQDENIADNGGIRLAYRAYRRLAGGGSPPPPRLPHCTDTSQPLALTPDQLFWVAAANVWCSADRVEHLRSTTLNGEHVPNRFRINGPLSNLAPFADDFGCPAGAPMRRPAERRCRVW